MLAEPVDSANQEWDSSDVQEKTRFFESLLDQNPALSFAMSVADLMHKMRELFVDIAVLEGEERGIFVGQQTPDADSLLDAPHAEEASALGLQLQEEPQNVPVFPSVSVEDDPPMFELDDMFEEKELDVPGQFTPVAKPASLESSKRPQETAFQHLNPAVNPYAALALSSVLATLFVVGVVVGRHYYLTSRAKGGDDNVEDEMERGEASASNDDDEKPVVAQPSTGSSGDEPLVEIDEKAAMELEPSTDSNLSPEQVEAKEAMALLIDVANAAFASALTPSKRATILDSPRIMPAAVVGTPKAVSSALDTLRTEAINTPQTRYLQLLQARSRPSTPVQMSSPSPALVLVPAYDSEKENKDNMESISRPGSPGSGASSFVSAYSHMPKWSVGRAAGRKTALGLGNMFIPPPPQRGALLPHQHVQYVDSVSRAASPAPGTALAPSAVASPAMSYVTAIERASTSIPICDTSATTTRPSMDRSGLVSRLADSFHTPPTRPASPASGFVSTFTASAYHPQPPGALFFYGEEEQGGESSTQTSTSMRARPTMLPPAQLTQTALELALMLPATEWIFQFIVVFIGWFGFWMRPVASGARRI